MKTGGASPGYPARQLNSASGEALQRPHTSQAGATLLNYEVQARALSTCFRGGGAALRPKKSARDAARTLLFIPGLAHGNGLLSSLLAEFVELEASRRADVEFCTYENQTSDRCSSSSRNRHWLRLNSASRCFCRHSFQIAASFPSPSPSSGNRGGVAPSSSVPSAGSISSGVRVLSATS